MSERAVRTLAITLAVIIVSASLGLWSAPGSASSSPPLPATITRSHGDFVSSVRISGMEAPTLSYPQNASKPVTVSVVMLDSHGYTLTIPSFESKKIQQKSGGSQTQTIQLPWQIDLHKQHGLFGMKVFLWDADGGIPRIEAGYNFIILNNMTQFHIAEISSLSKGAASGNNVASGSTQTASDQGGRKNLGAICTEEPPSPSGLSSCAWLEHLASSPASTHLANLLPAEKVSEVKQAEKEKTSKGSDISVNPSKARIGFVAPTFTGAAYDNAYYIFYVQEISNSSPKVTTHTSYLTQAISPNVNNPASYPMYTYATYLRKSLPNANITMLTDTDVDAGTIFHVDSTGKLSNAYDVLVLGHEEYVTQQEYNNFKLFVENGGMLVVIDGNVLFAEVKYNKSNQTITVPNFGNVTLVDGHDWAYNGQYAYHSVFEKWYAENADWFGSNYVNVKALGGKLGNNPFDYQLHEEQELKNRNAVILFNYQDSVPGWGTGSPIVCAYELQHGKGEVIVLGLFFDDIAWNEKALQFFSSIVTNYAIPKEATK